MKKEKGENVVVTQKSVMTFLDSLDECDFKPARMPQFSGVGTSMPSFESAVSDNVVELSNASGFPNALLNQEEVDSIANEVIATLKYRTTKLARLKDSHGPEKMKPVNYEDLWEDDF